MLQELKRKFALKTPEERAYTLVKAYLRTMEGCEDDAGSERCRTLFRERMLQPGQAAAKERALERVFDEMIR